MIMSLITIIVTLFLLGNVGIPNDVIWELAAKTIPIPIIFELKGWWLITTDDLTEKVNWVIVIILGVLIIIFGPLTTIVIAGFMGLLSIFIPKSTLLIRMEDLPKSIKWFFERK